MGDISTAIVKVTPISGCRQEFAPFCYLLEIDQARILLDVGGTPTFDPSHLYALKKLTRTLDLILLSHGDLEHCGGLPQLLSMMDISCPVLTTVPVHHLGLVTLYDAYQSYYQLAGTAPPVTLDEIDTAFERITMLRYSQSFVSAGIQVTPVAAGHTLGGAIWRIRRHSEEIFYAMDFNHKREAHLDGASLEGVQRPSLLIADAKGALEVHSARKQRDSDFIEAVMSSLKSGGSVLAPTDTAGRSLELLQVIEAYWTSNKVAYPVFFLSHQSQRVIDLAKGMLEWMSQSLAKVFEQDRSNPFDLGSIRIVHSMEQVTAVAGPKVIISSIASLDTGFSLSLLSDILSNASSSVILTTKSDSKSMAAKILSCSKGAKIVIQYSEEVPLEGDDLQKYKEAEREAIELKAAEEAFAQLQRQREDEDDSGDEEGTGDVETLEQVKRLEHEQINSAAALQNFYWTDYKQDWFVDQEMLPSSINSPFYPLIPPDMAILPSGVPLRHQVFPLKETRYVFDNYGENVDPSDFKPKTMHSKALNNEAQVPATPLIQAIAPITEPENKSTAVPMRWITKTLEVSVKSTRKYIDFTGISDGRSLKTIYSRVQPRRLLLVGGSRESTDYLLNHFQQTLAHSNKTMEVFAPTLMETVTVSSAVNVMQAIISESLISRLQLQLLGEYELGWVRGAVKIPEDGEVDDAPSAKRAATMIVLSAVESKSAPIMVGDPRLSEMRRLIQSELKIPAVFDSGDLVCGIDERRVVIRRNPTSGALTLEGPLCAEYYSVRSILYSSIAFLQ